MERDKESSQGVYNLLDKEFKNFFNELKSNSRTELDLEKCEIYDMIMTTLANEKEYTLEKEAKYRITDNEDPDVVMLDIIKRRDVLRSLLWMLESRLEQYLEEKTGCDLQGN